MRPIEENKDLGVSSAADKLTNGKRKYHITSLFICHSLQVLNRC